MQVVFTPLARRHLNEVHDYITNRASRDVADDYVTKLVDFCDGLALAPYRGRKRDELAPGLRVIGFGRRITVAFFIAQETVDIAGIYYGGRNYDADFKQ